MSIRIGGKRSSDEIQDLDGVSLGHCLHNIVTLGLAAGNSFKAELRSKQNLPGFYGGESGRNTSGFLDDSRISRYDVS